MKKPRICLIVDNPLRDLDGMVMLGWNLALKGAEVFLVPMAQQVYEVAALAPDLVLVNYLREANRSLVRAYSESGILVGVLDTEGGIFADVEEFLKTIDRDGLSYVDMYCVWGHRQHDLFSKHNLVPKGDLYLTGCPRFDLCAPQWREALPDRTKDGSKMILINTRTPGIFPRFQRGVEDEIKIMRSGGLSDSYVFGLLRELYLIAGEMITTVADMAKTFPDADIVLRPHPFENEKLYKALFEDLPNVRVVREGTVLAWIKSAQLLIHKDCLTAMEACLLDKEPISLEWIDAPTARIELLNSISHHAKSRAHLFELVERALKGTPLLPSTQMLDTRKKIISDWLYANDGEASCRVVDAILRTIDLKAKRPHKKRRTGILTHSGLTMAGFKDHARFIGRRFIGPHNYNSLKRHLMRSPDGSGKEFNLEHIHSTVERINMTASFTGSIDVGYAQETKERMVAFSSIRISASGDMKTKKETAKEASLKIEGKDSVAQNPSESKANNNRKEQLKAFQKASI
ncbi:MAG: surface carbohydrate biosynthesis protein [Thermodesulfobacteriota bacterium]